MADQQNNPNPAQGGAYQQDGLDKVRRVCFASLHPADASLRTVRASTPC
jgi:hypothetical protein